MIIPIRLIEEINTNVELLMNNNYFNDEVPNVNYDILARELSESSIYGKTLCTNCEKSELFFDYIVSTNAKSEWKCAIKIMFRCIDLMERFTIGHVFFNSETFSAPGQLTFRTACPHFKMLKEE